MFESRERETRDIEDGLRKKEQNWRSCEINSYFPCVGRTWSQRGNAIFPFVSHQAASHLPRSTNSVPPRSEALEFSFCSFSAPWPLPVAVTQALGLVTSWSSAILACLFPSRFWEKNGARIGQTGFRLLLHPFIWPTMRPSAVLFCSCPSCSTFPTDLIFILIILNLCSGINVDILVYVRNAVCLWPCKWP